MREKSSKKRIVLIGDSITHGTASHNYVNMLKNKLIDTKFELINAGLNGDLTINILNRIDDIIRCEPDLITIMIGTNDAIGTYRVEDRRRYIKTKGAQADAEFWTLYRFKEDYIKIITQLQNQTNALIGVLSIPILGETLDDPVLKHSIAFSEGIKEISTNLGVHYMPLNERMIDFITNSPSNQKYNYEKKLGLMIKGILTHYLGRSWQHIAKKNGLQLLTDHIHLSEKGASMVSDFIEEFIKTNF